MQMCRCSFEDSPYQPKTCDHTSFQCPIGWIQLFRDLKNADSQEFREICATALSKPARSQEFEPVSPTSPFVQQTRWQHDSSLQARRRARYFVDSIYRPTNIDYYIHVRNS